MKDGKLLVNEIPSLGILTIYAFCCTGRTNWLQKVTTPCLFPDEFSSLPFCFFDHSLLLFIIHIWFICIVALSNKGPIACTQLIQLAVMNLSSVTTPHGSPYTEAHWPEKQTVRLFVDLVTGVSQSGERRRRWSEAVVQPPMVLSAEASPPPTTSHHCVKERKEGKKVRRSEKRNSQHQPQHLKELAAIVSTDKKSWYPEFSCNSNQTRSSKDEW